nr:MAG TPA: hypothetical protein [Caudoviricetes sp.]
MSRVSAKVFQDFLRLSAVRRFKLRFSRCPARRGSLFRRSGAVYPRRGKPGGAFGAGEGRNHSQKIKRQFAKTY